MIVTRHWRAAGVALAVVLGLAGCRDSEPAPTVMTIPAGYIEVRDAEAGFVIAVPQDWQQVPLNAETLRRTAESVRSQNPKYAETLAAAEGFIRADGKLYAVHPDGSSNANLIVTDSRGETLEELPAQAVPELRNRGATIETQERTTLGGEATFKMTMQIPVTAEKAVPAVQYYLVKRGKAFVLTLTGQDPALEVIAQSLHLT